MCNYVVAQKKIEDTNSAHARLKETLDNIYWIFSPVNKALNYKFRLVIHCKNKIEPPTPQSTNLYIKSNIIRSHFFFKARVGRKGKMKQKKKKTTITICHHYKYLNLIKSKVTKLFPEPERCTSKVCNTRKIVSLDLKLKLDSVAQ